MISTKYRSSNREASSLSRAADAIESDWVIKVSKSEEPGKIYYYNKKTGERRWEPPSISDEEEIRHDEISHTSAGNRRAFAAQDRRGKSLEHEESTAGVVVASLNSMGRKRKCNNNNNSEDREERSYADSERAKRPRSYPTAEDVSNGSSNSGDYTEKSWPVVDFNFRLTVLSVVSAASISFGRFPTSYISMEISRPAAEDRHAISSVVPDIAAPVDDEMEDMEVDDGGQKVPCCGQDGGGADFESVGGAWKNALAEIERCEELVIIVDTNIWISDLAFLRGLVVSDQNRGGYVVVPYVVIDELDNIKEDSTKSTKTRKNARSAICWIGELLKQKSRRVLFQHMYVDGIATRSYPGKIKNDDRILCCVMEIAKLRAKQELTFLWTNDKNLLNKGLIHNVPSGTKDDLVKLLWKNSSTSNGLAYAPINSSAVPKTICALPSPQSQVTMTEQPLIPPIVDSYQIPPDVEQVMKSCIQVLSLIAEKEMQEKFGACWLDVAKVKPPWSTFSKLFDLFTLHWMALFSWEFAEYGAKIILTSLKMDSRNALTETLLLTKIFPGIVRFLRCICLYKKSYRGDVESVVSSIERLLSSRKT